MKHVLFTFAMFLSTCAPAPVLAQQQAGFQQLPWGASVAQIKEKFPEAVPAECPSNIKPALAARGIACSLLQVPHYAVADLNFELTFYLDKNNYAMQEVGLLASVDLEQRADRTEKANAVCDRLQELLSTRYGLPEVKQSVFDKNEMGRESNWGAASQAATRVSLWCYTNVSMPTMELAIGYKPASKAAVEKL